MYNKILVPLDGSQRSESILPYARFFAATLKIPVELLHVVDPGVLMPSVISHQGRYYDVMTAEKKGSGEYLRKIAASFPELVSVDPVVEIGRAAEIIVDRSAKEAGTLTAMTTHGRTGLDRLVLGSIAEKVLRAAANHLLLVRATEESKKDEAISFKRVLVSLDGSRLAELAIPHAAELAKKMDLAVVLARVFTHPVPVYTAESYNVNLRDLWEQIEKETREYLEEKLQDLKRQGLERVSTVAVEGYAPDKILQLARAEPLTLVAMCTHGRSGMGRWVLGSVTERVIRHSEGPVLVIRASTESRNVAS
jgi:nucleotide-binding universal stress UspA family protein